VGFPDCILSKVIYFYVAPSNSSWSIIFAHHHKMVKIFLHHSLIGKKDLITFGVNTENQHQFQSFFNWGLQTH